LGGISQQPQRAGGAQGAPAWGPAPVNYGGSNVGTRITAATGNLSRDNQGDPAAAAFLMLVLLAAALAIAILPAGIAYLANRMAIRRGRDIRQFAITLALLEPAWALLLWYWLTRAAWWPSLVALLIPAGYAAFIRFRRTRSL
jgi:hypothetical protein